MLHTLVLLEALEKANNPVPPELKILANSFKVKRDQGLISEADAKIHSGYVTGKGFKYDDEEEKARNNKKKQVNEVVKCNVHSIAVC
jgi:hypothetical protein